jgi:hypothetical protein
LSHQLCSRRLVPRCAAVLPKLKHRDQPRVPRPRAPERRS